MGVKLKEERFRLDIGRNFFHQDGQGVAQIAQRGCAHLKVFQANWIKP